MSATFWLAAIGVLSRRRPVGRHSQEAGRTQLVDRLARQVSLLGRKQFIAGQLLGHELVERLVGIERADHIVPILERLGPRQVLVVEALGVGVTGRVEPMAAPAFAIVRRGQQTIDELFVSVGRRVGEICVDLGRRGGRPNRSSDSRRISVRRSVSGEKPSCLGLSAAASRASMGVESGRPGQTLAASAVEWTGSTKTPDLPR